MNIVIKIRRRLLEEVRADLARPHSFAYERVGFLITAAATMSGGVLLTVCDYQPVADDDYERNQSVGAQIGSNAMRKAVQAAFRPQRGLFHVHTHGGHGKPGFSAVDLQSSADFVPGFYHPIPKMLHGLLVLSDDSAQGLLWEKPELPPTPITHFISVGGPYFRDWRTQ